MSGMMQGGNFKKPKYNKSYVAKGPNAAGEGEAKDAVNAEEAPKE